MPSDAQVEIHRRALDQVTARVELIGDDQWELPTPCTEWNVRALVKHLVSGTSWVGPLVDGLTIAEVGNRFDGDLLGDDPKPAWRRAAAAAVEACGSEGAMGRLVHLSAGDVPASEYIDERILDLSMHIWDLARAIGADETLEPDLVEAATKVLADKADLWRSAGLLGPATETAPGADAQTLLLAESGRRP
jgi:uncharacterized protein (TIGR03086 family)